MLRAPVSLTLKESALLSSWLFSEVIEAAEEGNR